MWCDNFDLDLYKVLPEAQEILAQVADVKLYTHGDQKDGALNHPSCWNYYLGMVAFFGFIPTHIKPESFYTDKEVVACTFEQAVRDCWPHNYTVLLSVFVPGQAGQIVPIWSTGTVEMKNHFYTILKFTRKWGDVPNEEVFRAKSRVLDSLRSAAGRLAAVLEAGPARQQ